MIFNVGISDQKEANIFLRKLWAAFRQEFGKCTWQYIPYKDGKTNTIFFGMMDIGITEGVLEVSISYSKKGTIRDIKFNLTNSKKSNNKNKNLQKKIQTLIHTAKTNLIENKFIPETRVTTIHRGLGYYKGEAFSIHRSYENRFNIAIETLGYDYVDAATEYNRKLLHCLDLLSVETNSPFWNELVNQGDQIVYEEEENFVEGLDWIDDYPVIAKKLTLSKAGKKFLDLIAKDEVEKSQETFLRACNHFHTARKYDSQVYDQLKYSSIDEIETGVYEITIEERDERLSMAAKMGATHREVASVLYISALEVASSIGVEPKNCTECGQEIYGIRYRVGNMVEKYLNAVLAKEFKSYYDKRSKYLHAGKLLFNYSYMGTTIPQLNPLDPTGCNVHCGIPLKNLREYTSFCLRKVLQSLVAVNTDGNA
jgi:hypothetical protein